ncbi:MAG: Rne/Rng family ribonuclease [Neisseriaceae bacterium]|nr:MAG: Rne/Rng family ribonuclease [Neisseriaceae bacterium]
MKRMLFNATYAEELRVASVDGKKLLNFDIETSSKEQRRGNIYKGFVTRVEPSLEACFVDYGHDKQGFLPFKEIDYRYLPEIDGQKSKDFTKLPLGTEMIIQVDKDERGNKGAALTTYVTLPGRYLVLMPNNSRSGGISRRIEGAEREELKNLMSQLTIPNGMSIILRTAALGRAVEELAWDLTYLTRLWEMIVNAGQEKGAFLIYLESSLVIRSIRDHFSPDISEILIDTEEVYNQARSFMSLVMPNFADRVKHYHDDVPLFSRFQIEHQIESAYSRMVTLPSGGVIVIDHTEALTAVDVNSAKANKGADIETTAFLTNLEAAEEVARQLRLRDLGGLVVVDFIDMENPRNQRDVENHFNAQLSLDRARIQMGKLSKFGLLELSRQRLQASLDESTTVACPRCSGVGSIRGIESSALHILRLVQEDVIKNSGQLSAIHVQLPVDIATYLLNERRDDVAKIEARVKVKIVLVPNVHLNSPQYKIKKLSYDLYDSNFHKSSYNLVEVPEETLGYNSVTKKSDNANKVPAVQQISNLNPAPVVEKKSKSIFAGLVKTIGSWFSSEPEKPAPKSRNGQNRNNNNRTKKDFNGAERNPRNNRNKDTITQKPLNNSNERNNRNVSQEKPREQVEDNKNIVQQQVTPRAENPNNKVKQPKSLRNLNTNANVDKPQKADGEYVRPAEKKRFNKPNDLSNKSNASETNNQAEKSSNVDVSVTPVVSDVKVNNFAKVEHKAESVVVKQEEVKTTITVKEVSADVPVKPYVPEVVDLGSMELISTSADALARVVEHVEHDDVTLPRFNDVERVQKTVDMSNQQYELVETKN